MSENEKPIEPPLSLQQLEAIAVSVQDHLNTLCLALVIVRDAYGMFFRHERPIAMDAILQSIKGSLEVDVAMPIIAENLRITMMAIEDTAAKLKSGGGYKNGKN